MNMTNVLVTGSGGFIGKHLVEALERRQAVRVTCYDVGNTADELEAALAEADIIFHLAGVNRPQDPTEYQAGNVGFTQTLCRSLQSLGRKPTIILSSSVQATLENPYGISKRQAEEVLVSWARATGGRVVIFRLKNVFGKWCRPNYNSVTATFCHNIAHGLPISISDPAKELELVYIDDVIAAFLRALEEKPGRSQNTQCPGQCPEEHVYREVEGAVRVTLGELANKIRSFRESRRTLQIPSFADDFTRHLYATYVSYLEGADLAYPLDIKVDQRGCLAEFMKSPHLGQIFISRTKPGITRGNHYHDTKAEKFMVVEGEGVIRFRLISTEGRRPKAKPGDNQTAERGQEAEIIEHRVSGKDFRVVDIPPGHTHSIENVGQNEMVVVFWASEVFDPAKPDTFAAPVLIQGGK